MQALAKIITVNGNNKRDLQLKILELNEIDTHTHTQKRVAST